MDEKLNNAEDWTSLEKWMAELIEQKKADAKRWFIISIVLLVALVATNVYWIHEMNTYEYVYQDGSGQNNYNRNIGGNVSNVAIGESEEEWTE